MPVRARAAAQWFDPPVTRAAATSNQDAAELPFQRWYRFKEAFTPAFVRDMIASAPRPVRHCADPFGGSGTSALTCQFLGIRASTIEVNPFLADLIEAKLSPPSVANVLTAQGRLVRRLRGNPAMADAHDPFPGAPATFVEPGVNGRWLFDAPVAARVAQMRRAIASEPDVGAQRLMRVALATSLIPSSHVVISGKGRRYRRQANTRPVSVAELDRRFHDTLCRMIEDLAQYPTRASTNYRLLRGDSRALIRSVEQADLLLCSPPYPNSFDYTDIYNVELWALGYLQDAASNRALRLATLRSHVQIARDWSVAHLPSPTLRKCLAALSRKRGELWNPNLPQMVAGYFDDLCRILEGAHAILTPRAHALFVVGDSRYAGVLVDVAKILGELAPSRGFRCIETRAVRAMRASAQQGGVFSLGESLVRLERNK